MIKIKADQLIQVVLARVGKLGAAAVAIVALLLAVFAFIPDSRTRWIAVTSLAAVVVLLLGVRLFFWWRTRRTARSMQQALDAEQQEALASAHSTEERARVQEIRRRFQDAVDELGRANRKVYDLPWYMLIGEAQSGKSMTLRGSELHFPVGTDKLSGLGGTRNCDWWFTNEAVILDTAGRFTFQEEGAPDKAEWEGFLRLLSRKRKHCPINGVIVVIPTDKLMNDPPDVRDSKAKNLQSKLGELQREMGVQFPVFILITKCDLVLGFSEFFRAFGEVQASQLIGWSNEAPFNKPYDESGFEASFQSVYQKLCRQRLDVLRKPAALDERGLAFSFPEEFKALAKPLQQCFKVMFSQDIYHDPLFFRGYYFTSGVQTGEPIAKMWKEVLGGGTVPAVKEFDALGTLFPPRPFFIADFYKKKALREKGLVFRSASEIRRGRALRKWTFVGGGAALGLFLAFLVAGSFKVKALFNDPREHANDAAAMIRDTNKYRDDPDLPKRYEELQIDAANLRAGGFWIRLLTAFHGGHKPADSILALHDALFMRRELLPLTEKMERDHYLSDWPADRGEELAESLREYVSWWTGNTPDATNAERRFKLMYAPIWGTTGPVGDEKTDSTAQHSIPERFKSLTHFELLGAKAMDVDARPDGKLHRAILAAKEYFEGFTDGQLENDLRPWVRLHRACAALSESYTQVLALTSDFQTVSTIGQYQELDEEWDKLYRGPAEGGELSFAGALEQVKSILPQLTLKDAPPDAKAPSREFKLPRLDDVRPKWRSYFHEAGEAEGTLDQMLARPKAPLPKETCERVQDWLKQVAGDLDKKADTTINEIKENHNSYSDTYKVATLCEVPAGIAEHLAKVNNFLPAERPPQLKANLMDWRETLERINTPSRGNEPGQVSSGSCKDGRWGQEGLQPFEAAVRELARRHQWYVELDQASKLLADNYLELLRLPAELPKKTAPELKPAFGDVERRWTAPGLREVVREVEELQKTLQKCQGNGCTLLDDVKIDPDEENPSDRNPAEKLSRELEEKLSDYARRYFDGWCQRYKGSKVNSYDQLMLETKWRNFRALVASPPEQAKNFAEHAGKQLTAFEDNVLAVEFGTHPGEGEPLNAPRQKMIQEARANNEVCGLRFSRAFRFARNVNADKPAIVSKVTAAFDRFVTSVRKIDLDPADSPHGSAIGDVDTKDIDELRNGLEDERISIQLVNVAQQGRYLLNGELDSRLSNFVERRIGDDRNAFPFAKPALGEAQPKQVGVSEFQSFLTDMFHFNQRFGAVAEWNAQTFAPNDEKVGRKEFLRRAVAWREFLYGAAKDPHAAKEWNPRDPKPEPVFFNVTYEEPDRTPLVASQYITATLALGGWSDPRRELDYHTEQRLVEVNMTALQENKPQTRGWRFGDRSDVSLTLGKADAPTLPVTEASLKDTVWALPLFVYRYCGATEFGKVAPGTTETVPPRTVWPVQIPVVINKQPHWMQFTIQIKNCGEGKCGLPEPIGWFHPSTTEPQPLKLDPPD